MSDLVEFLSARVAEDEVVARAATLGHDARPIHVIDWDYGPGSERDMTPAQDEAHRMWSPWRALAECEAKRRIVEQHVENKSRVTAYRSPRWIDAMNDEDRLNWRKAEARAAATEGVLRSLAQIYADHPDYSEEWRP